MVTQDGVGVKASGHTTHIYVPLCFRTLRLEREHWLKDSLRWTQTGRRDFREKLQWSWMKLDWLRLQRKRSYHVHQWPYWGKWSQINVSVLAKKKKVAASNLKKQVCPQERHLMLAPWASLCCTQGGWVKCRKHISSFGFYFPLLFMLMFNARFFHHHHDHPRYCMFPSAVQWIPPWGHT